MTRQRAEGMGVHEDGRRYMYVSDVPRLVKGNGVLSRADCRLTAVSAARRFFVGCM
jgi:hypothetical protein